MSHAVRLWLSRRGTFDKRDSGQPRTKIDGYLAGISAADYMRDFAGEPVRIAPDPAAATDAQIDRRGLHQRDHLQPRFQPQRQHALMRDRHLDEAPAREFQKDLLAKRSLRARHDARHELVPGAGAHGNAIEQADVLSESLAEPIEQPLMLEP